MHDWGVKEVIMVSVLASEAGIKRVARTLENEKLKVKIYVGGIDKDINEKGMIVPGIGDIGDRLFVARGK